MDQKANRELFEEQVEIIFKAFHNDSFSHKGKHYTLPPEVPYRGYTLKDITLVPRPFRQPVDCWQPIQGARCVPSSSWRSMGSGDCWVAVLQKAVQCIR